MCEIVAYFDNLHNVIFRVRVGGGADGEVIVVLNSIVSEARMRKGEEVGCETLEARGGRHFLFFCIQFSKLEEDEGGKGDERKTKRKQRRGVCIGQTRPSEVFPLSRRDFDGHLQPFCMIEQGNFNILC